MTEDEDAPALPAARPVRLAAGRKAVVARLWKAAARQIAAHEARLDGLPQGAGASEADAKALATLARTVRELVALEGASARPGARPADEMSPAESLAHVAELRAGLARRLEALAAGGAGPGREGGSADAER